MTARGSPRPRVAHEGGVPDLSGARKGTPLLRARRLLGARAMPRITLRVVPLTLFVSLCLACGGTTAGSSDLDSGRGPDAQGAEDSPTADVASPAEGGRDASGEDAGSDDGGENGCALLKAADADVQCGKPCDFPGVSCSPGGPGDPLGWACEAGPDGGTAVWMCSGG
jgi:hypothetical protein